MQIFRAFKFLAMSVILFTLSASLTAQQQQQVGVNKSFYYSVTDVGTLGGTFSFAYGITDNNWVNGFSTLAGDASQHAFIWRNGTVTDLGTLGGPNSQAYGRMNNRGDVPGYSDTTVPNPLGEDNCYFGTYLTCAPFVWRNGVMTRLGTLGGYNGWAIENNNSGQIVGTAENTTPDPNCLPPQVLQFRPVIWDKGQIHELPIYTGDSQGVAYTINEKGQVAGASGNCFTSPDGFFDLWRHPLLWEQGKMTYLGSFGGVRNNVANQINNKGQIVGTSDLPGDAIRHAFLWERSHGRGNGTMTDLGTLAGDVSSEGWSINNKGEIVGASCDAEGNCRAVLWQHGAITDLNSLIFPGTTSLYLLTAYTINANGSVVGAALDTTTFEVHGFLAQPTAVQLSVAARSVARPNVRPTIPAGVRKAIR